ncbi:hypothetical protein AC579_2540 [Pseudocercospora musae]|uniref:Uncharacterized protein n=1 Tax=Pseudocercospora musae TaxID=113226 RepID=A0A139I2V0_9PEZI|nr:hypothetical protein AC579_2540 [Pseudocercospora musae]
MPSQDQNYPAYTPEEKAYIKQQWGSEYYMLRDYGMSIYKEEHREEGRAIVRGFMEQVVENEGKGKGRRRRVVMCDPESMGLDVLVNAVGTIIEGIDEEEHQSLKS